MKRRWLGLGAQAAVSAVLLVLVFRRIDPRDALQAILRLRPATLAGALALSLAAYWARALRWRALLARAGVRIRTWEAYRLTLIGILYGLVTPGRIGELARVLHIDQPRARTLPSAVWDRVADFLLLEALAVPAVVVLGTRSASLPWAWGAVVAGTAVLVAALNSTRVLHLLERVAPSAAHLIASWRVGATGMLFSRTFGLALVAGIGYYALNFAGAFLLLRATAPDGPPQLILGLPLLPLLGNLPVALGGLGLRESVAAALFQAWGAGPSAGPVFSLTWFAVATLFPGLVGLLLALAGRSRAAEPRPAVAAADGEPRSASRSAGP